jgi:hypothetical protein
MKTDAWSSSISASNREDYPIPANDNLARIHRIVVLIAALLLVAAPHARAQAHVIEITGDSDSRYKIAGQRTPGITVKASKSFCG